jgi:hypothetical protein
MKKQKTKKTGHLGCNGHLGTNVWTMLRVASLSAKFGKNGGNGTVSGFSRI